MTKWLIYISAAAIAIPSGVPAQGADVTIDEYLERVRTTHPYFRAEQLQPAIERQGADSFLGRQDWRLKGEARFAHLEPLPTSPFQPERVDVFALGAGTERLFWGSGSRLAVDWVSDVSDQNLPGLTIPGPGGGVEIPIGPSTFYRHVLRATWSLPLWQNRGGELDRLEYETGLYDVDASVATSRENQENFLLDAGTTFLFWALAEEQIGIAERRLELAVEEFERSKRQRAAFLVDEVDVWRSEAAVHNTQSALSLIESRWKSLQADLATIAGDSTYYSRRPRYDLFALPDPPDADAFVAGIVNTARLVRALDYRRDQLARLEAGYADTKRPSLDLNLSGALQGGGESWGGAFEMKYPDFGAGLVFSYPLGTRTASANVERTRLELRQLEERIRAVQISLGASARRIIVELVELRDVIAANKLSIEANEKRTGEELKLYNQGRGDLAFVIQARDNIALSELEYAGNVATYHNLLLRLEALSDQLLPVPDAGAEDPGQGR